MESLFNYSSHSTIKKKKLEHKKTIMYVSTIWFKTFVL